MTGEWTTVAYRARQIDGSPADRLTGNHAGIEQECGYRVDRQPKSRAIAASTAWDENRGDTGKHGGAAYGIIDCVLSRAGCVLVS
jgi:surface antigen